MVPILMVPRRGLEPPRLAPLVPETSASTNSATWAWRLFAATGPECQRRRPLGESSDVEVDTGSRCDGSLSGSPLRASPHSRKKGTRQCLVPRRARKRAYSPTSPLIWPEALPARALELLHLHLLLGVIARWRRMN